MSEDPSHALSYVSGPPGGGDFTSPEIEALEHVNRRIASGESLTSIIDSCSTKPGTSCPATA